MLAQVENSVYLCTAFERKRFHKESIGSLGEWNVGIRFLCSVDVSIILWDMCWMNTDLRSIRAGRSFMDIVTAAGG